MKKHFLITTLVALFALPVALGAEENKAKDIEISSFRYAGPYKIQSPYQIDSVSNSGKKYTAESMLERNLSFEGLKGAATASALPAPAGDALGLLAFSLENTLFAKATISVEGLKHHKLFVDGRESGPQVKLEPGTHEVIIKYLSLEDSKDSLKVKVTPEKENRISVRDDGKRIYSLDVNSMGVNCGGMDISASGKYISLYYRTTKADGKSESYSEIIETATNKVILRTRDYIYWMPTSDRYYYTRQGVSAKELYCCDPATGEETCLCKAIPEGYYTISPTEDFLITSVHQPGPQEGEVHQILEPDDRHPGWRDRSYIAKFDLATGMLLPLTYGYHSSWAGDISADGKKLLFFTSRSRLEKRPTTVYQAYVMDLETLEVTEVSDPDGFANGGSFSPDGTKILMRGCAEAFGGVGKDVKEGQIPNGYDIQLFIVNIADRSVFPLTKDFNPSIEDYEWSSYDGKIYVLTEDKDCRNLYRLDPKNGKSEFLGNKEEYLSKFSLAKTAPTMVYYGQSLCNYHRAYTLNTKNGKHQLIHDFSADRLQDTQMGEGYGYEFTSSRGDVINGFYVLPPDFDPNKKYPLLVHYYGGCSPTSRYCIGAYSPQVYAAQGYIFYVINPSGAAGFGQEFAARHVNTAGDVVADDIIEGTQKFCEDHPYVNKDKIGCFSASYGGFMTQLLLSKTDIYATGISHAGISDHTSYWGEGYWGYSYSEVSMADSYPWTRKDLYVDRSPLYNADKIHTPLLFLHGSADVNVPIGESIQMFTALKLLGAETAFVVVDGEDHGVVDYSKRRQWLRTIFAWFSKYLQDDDTWWNELYPEKNL